MVPIAPIVPNWQRCDGGGGGKGLEGTAMTHANKWQV